MVGTIIQLPFELVSAELSGASLAPVDRIATAGPKGAVEVIIVAHDTETLDPRKRHALTDLHIATLIAAVAAPRVAAGAIRTL